MSFKGFLFSNIYMRYPLGIDINRKLTADLLRQRIKPESQCSPEKNSKSPVLNSLRMAS
jgi:hypothetical protein